MREYTGQIKIVRRKCSHYVRMSGNARWQKAGEIILTEIMAVFTALTTAPALEYCIVFCRQSGPHCPTRFRRNC